MSDYEVGYKKPPDAHRFKPGVSPNPKGRPPKPKSSDLATVIVEGLNAPIEYQEGGRLRTASGRDLNVMMLVKRAVKGDVEAALALLRKRAQAERRGSVGAERIEISDWPPDFLGQTAEQKNHAYLNRQGGASAEWWIPSTKNPADPKT